MMQRSAVARALNMPYEQVRCVEHKVMGLIEEDLREWLEGMSPSHPVYPCLRRLFSGPSTGRRTSSARHSTCRRPSTGIASSNVRASAKR